MMNGVALRRRVMGEKFVFHEASDGLAAILCTLIL